MWLREELIESGSEWWWWWLTVNAVGEAVGIIHDGSGSVHILLLLSMLFSTLQL